MDHETPNKKEDDTLERNNKKSTQFKVIPK